MIFEGTILDLIVIYSRETSWLAILLSHYLHYDAVASYLPRCVTPSSNIFGRHSLTVVIVTARSVSHFPYFILKLQNLKVFKSIGSKWMGRVNDCCNNNSSSRR
ncbi:hypothetical protein AAZX31_02G179600 [Glycine max]